MIRVLLVDDQAVVRRGLCVRFHLEPDLQVVGEASTSSGAGSTLCQCGSPPVAGVGDNKLSGLHVGSRAGAVRDRDRVDGKSPQAGRLPDGIVGPGLARTGLGDRCRGLRAHR